ncbi:MAG: hypothetical protein EOP48_04600 [Sphingobacteriales bacterium]|nr:MAG: hypothetical protein EOP48_04600 [Sphingobacteriales bacterium]
MSPDYVRRFVQTKQLNRGFRDVFTLLREKTERLYKKHAPFTAAGIVARADVKQLDQASALQPFLGRANLVLASPPYLGIVNYAKQNWIRLWFLDQEPEAVSEFLDDDLNLTEWVDFADKAIRQLKTFMAPDGVGVFVIGDVAKSKNSVIPLAREFCLLLRESALFKNVWCVNDAVEDVSKTTRIWGETKGSATAIDRVVIFSDINPFEKFANKQAIQTLDLQFVEESTKAFIGGN